MSSRRVATWTWTILTVAALPAGAPAALRAMQVTLDSAAFSQAVSLGQSAIASDLVRFHEAYRIPASVGAFDYFEVVTPFRRIVLAAEERARSGDRRFGQREAMQLDAETPGRLAVYAELTFHPLNTFVLVPEYQVSLVLPDRTRLDPLTIDRAPRYGPRVSGGRVRYAPGGVQGGAIAGRTQPMLGATIEATFDGQRLGPRCDRDCTIVVSEGGNELVRVKLALAALR